MSEAFGKMMIIRVYLTSLSIKTFFVNTCVTKRPRALKAYKREMQYLLIDRDTERKINSLTLNCRVKRSSWFD